MLATYADGLYKEVKSYIESREFETQQKLAEIRQGKAMELSAIKRPKPGHLERRSCCGLKCS